MVLFQNRLNNETYCCVSIAACNSTPNPQPLPPQMKLIYDHIIVNEGNAWIPSDSKLVVPINGIYIFAYNRPDQSFQEVYFRIIANNDIV